MNAAILQVPVTKRAFALVLGLGLGAAPSSWALPGNSSGPSKAPSKVAAKGKPGKAAGAKSGKSAKAKKGKRTVFSGYQVDPEQYRVDPLPRPSGHLRLYAVNFDEELEVYLYDKNGAVSDEALAALNHFWRCRRTGTEKPIDARLFETLSMISDRFDGRRIELVSGFRNQPHTTSFHFHGSASDIRIQGVENKTLQKYVASLDTGHMGLGIYPRAGFVHVDVRAPEPSYRWVDYSKGGGEGAKAKRQAKAPTQRKSPNS